MKAGATTTTSAALAWKKDKVLGDQTPVTAATSAMSYKTATSSGHHSSNLSPIERKFPNPRDSLVTAAAHQIPINVSKSAASKKVTPEDVKGLKAPTDQFLCRLTDNWPNF